MLSTNRFGTEAYLLRFVLPNKRRERVDVFLGDGVTTEVDGVAVSTGASTVARWVVELLDDRVMRFLDSCTVLSSALRFTELL